MKRDVRRVTSLDELRLLESERHVGVHAGVEVLDDCGVVEGLALLLRTTKIVVEAEMTIFSLDREKHLIRVKKTCIEGRRRLLKTSVSVQTICT
jgi:uncharacterized protein (UPF0212 family)